MKLISFKHVTECLKDFNAFRVIHFDADVLYEDVKFLSIADEKPRKAFIYIGKTSEIAGCEKKYMESGLLLMDNSNFDSSELTANIAIFPSNTDICSLFNTVQSLFDSQTILQRYSAAMLSLLTEGKSLQDIIHAAADMLGNPVLLPDSSGRLITVSRDSEISEPASKDLMTLGYVTGSFIREFQINKMDLKISEAIPLYYLIPALLKISGGLFIRLRCKKERSLIFWFWRQAGSFEMRTLK